MALMVNEDKLRTLLEEFAEDARWVDDGGKPDLELIEKLIEECKKRP
jgi:hypothetical protein